MKNKKKVIIIALCVLALGMGIGYSILQTQLKITGTGTVKDMEFGVEIVGLEENLCSRPLTDLTGNNTGSTNYNTCSAPTTKKGYTSTTATFDVTFDPNEEGHQFVTYKILIKNTGGMTAYFDSVTVTSTENSAITVTTPVDLDGTYLLKDQTVIYFVTLDANYRTDYTSYSTNVDVTFNVKQADIQDATRLTTGSVENAFKPYIWFSNEALHVIQMANSAYYNNSANLYVSIDGGSYVRTNLEFGGTNGISTAYGFDNVLEDLPAGQHTIKIKYVGSSYESNEVTYHYYVAE